MNKGTRGFCKESRADNNIARCLVYTEHSGKILDSVSGAVQVAQLGLFAQFRSDVSSLMYRNSLHEGGVATSPASVEVRR